MIINDVTNTNIQAPQLNVGKQGNLLTPSKADEAVGVFEKVVTRVGAPMGQTGVSKGSYGEIAESLSTIEEELKVNAQVAKDNLKALFNKLSGAETEELTEKGFDINDMEDEELLDVVDRIKIMLAAYNENFQAFAGALNMPSDAAVAADGNLAAKVAKSLSQNNMPATEGNITEVMGTVDMAKDVCKNPVLSDEAKAYMIENDLEPTVENLYVANHSTINNGYTSSVTEDMWNQLKTQAEEIINRSDISTIKEQKETALTAAKWLLDHQLPITDENIAAKLELDELKLFYNEDAVITGAVLNLAQGKEASMVYADDTQDVLTMAAKAIGITSNATYQDVEDTITKKRPFTIEELAARISERLNKASKDNLDKEIKADDTHTDTAVTSAYRTVCEARVLMTASSVVSIINRGIDIYKEDLNSLVNILHETEIGSIIEEFSDKNAGSISEEDLKTVANVNDALLGLRFMPASALGYTALMSKTEVVTVTAIYETGANLKREYEAAGTAYETMSTSIRSDMGDSLNKAVENSIDNILEELNMENIQANKRAVRILSANSLDITTENINTIKEIDSTVNNLIDNMNPQVVLDMIRDKVNPMDTDINVLNKYIEENYDTEADVSKYSEFLYKLENTEGITKEERQQYIGIYKMFNMFKKDAGKAVGALINEGADITLSNMVMAVKTSSKIGMDERITAETGMAEVSGVVSYYDNLFSNLAKNITPAMLKDAENTKKLSDLTLEKLNELAQTYKEKADNVDKEIYEKQAEDIRNYDFANTDEDIIRILTDNNLPVSFYNIMAANQLSSNAKVYESIYNQADEKIQEDMENIFNNIDDETKLMEAYEKLSKDEKEEVARSISKDVSGEGDSFSLVNHMKNSSKVIELAASLSKSKQFFVPFKTEDGIGTINLKIVNGSGEQSQMAMTFYTEELGNVYGQFDFGKESIAGYMVSDKEDGADLIVDKLQDADSKMSQLGFSDVKIMVSHSGDVPQIHINETGEKPTNAAIYKAAKEILTSLIQV